MQANTFEFTGKQFYLQIACFTALLYFTCMVQTYNNSYTRFDWYEHYYRARQILGDFSLYEKIQSPVGPYHYLARPPLQNFIVAKSGFAPRLCPEIHQPETRGTAPDNGGAKMDFRQTPARPTKSCRQNRTCGFRPSLFGRWQAAAHRHVACSWQYLLC